MVLTAFYYPCKQVGNEISTFKIVNPYTISPGLEQGYRSAGCEFLVKAFDMFGGAHVCIS